LDGQLKRSGLNYNPEKYVRGYDLLKGVNVSQLPEIPSNDKKKEKYTYEDYLRIKNQNNNQNSNLNLNFNKNEPNTNTNAITNMNVTSNKLTSSNNNDGKFSYEQYTMNKSQTNSSKAFNEISNNYNNNQFDKKEDLRKTSVVPQNENSFIKGQHFDTSNPYSTVNLDDFNQNKMESTSFGTYYNNQQPYMQNINSQLGTCNINYPNTSNSFDQSRLKNNFNNGINNMSNNYNNFNNNISNMNNNMRNFNNNTNNFNENMSNLNSGLNSVNKGMNSLGFPKK
jgi:hypothetical protein